MTIIINKMLVGLLVSFLLSCLVYLLYFGYNILLIYRFDNKIKRYNDEHNIEIIFLVDSNIKINSKYVVTIEQDSKFINILRRNNKTNNPIYLIIHCHGGSVVSSDIMINAMMQHKNKIYSFIPHYASSAASLIALASENIYMDNYSYLTPNDPQITLGPSGNNETVSSKILKDFLKFKIKPKEKDCDTLLLSALDAKVYHKDNIETLKKIIIKKKIPKRKINKIIHIFASGKLPHHYPINRDMINDLGIHVNYYIPDQIIELFNTYSQL